MIYDESYFSNLETSIGKATLDGSRVHNNSKDTHIDWTRVHSNMSAIYPDLTLSSEGLRSQYRRLTDDAPTKGNVADRLLGLLHKKTPLTTLAKTLRVSEDAVMAAVAGLQLNGYTSARVWRENGVVYGQNFTKQAATNETVPLSGLYEGDTLTFGVVSDMHMGSAFCALDKLRAFYKYCKQKGVKTVLNAGDISEGYYAIRPASIFETTHVGYTEQLDHIVADYPHEDGIKTLFITGNHDATHFRNGFADIGKGIADRRPDMVYLGHNFARIPLTEALNISLVHPNDGICQSMSLKLQHIIDRNATRRSDIMLVGHYHKSLFVKYNGVYGYCLPSFQEQTPFMEDNNIVSDVGGMIFTVKVDTSGKLLSVIVEYLGN